MSKAEKPSSCTSTSGTSASGTSSSGTSTQGDSKQLYSRRRRYQRFDLEVPVCLRFPAEGVIREVVAISRNVSIGGLLLKTGNRLPVRTQVSLTLNVPSPWSKRTIRLLSEGEVVRVERLKSGEFAIAVQCRQPIREVGERLSTAS